MIAPTRVNGTGRGALLSFVVVVQRTRIVTAGSVSPASSLSSALDQPPKITQNCDFPCELQAPDKTSPSSRFRPYIF